MFYVKDKEKSVTAIEAIVSISGKKYKYATGLSVNPEFWNSTDHRAIYSRKNPSGKKINEKLSDLEGYILDAVEFYRWKQPPSPSEFREKVKVISEGGTDEKIHLGAYIEKYYKSRDYKYETRKKYVTAIRKISDYEKYYHKKVFLQDININFYNQFRDWFYSLINQKTEKP